MTTHTAELDNALREALRTARTIRFTVNHKADPSRRYSVDAWAKGSHVSVHAASPIKALGLAMERLDAPPAPLQLDQHLVAVGDLILYRGSDKALWGQPGTVIGLCTTPLRCSVEMDSGQTLRFADERELSREVPAGRDAR